VSDAPLSDRPAPRAPLAASALGAALSSVVAGAADASLALARSPAPPLESLGFSLGVAASLALVFAPSGALAALADRALSAERATTRVRAAAGALLGAALGVGLGLAAFSGSAMRRSPARPWLIAGVTVASLAALSALSAAWPALRARANDRRRALAGAATLAALTIWYVHATQLVRLYPALHAVAAALASGLFVLAGSLALSGALARKATRGALSVALGALLCVSAVGAGSLLRSQRARARARQHSALATYIVGAAARLLPRSHQAGIVDDDRAAPGPSLDLEGLDVLLVTVDALRWDRLGAYGHRGGLTPAIDAIAQGGIVVERAYCTTPHTSYSLASLMTGKFFRGVSALGPPARPHDTLAGLFAARGFATAAFYPPAVFSVDADRLGDLRARGFDFAHKVETYEPADRRAREAIAWLESQPRGRRTFLWVHLFEPHESYERHAGGRVVGGDSAESRYDAEVAAVDDAVRALREAYSRAGRRVAIFVTADHGEEFGEHGGRFHGTTVYDEQVRVPLVFSVPGLAPRRVAGPGSHVDLVPTILAGVGAPRPPRLRGRDLGPLAHGSPWARLAYASVNAERMVSSLDHKLVCDVSEGSCELFDLRADPRERNNLADARPDLLARLRPLIAGWDASHAVFEREGANTDELPADALPPAVERAIQGDRSAAVEASRAVATLDAPRAIRAVRALADLGVNDDSVRAALSIATRRNAVDLSLEAGVALARLGDRRGEGACRDALSSRDARLRRSAAMGLARLGARDGAPVLAEWLSDPRASDTERDAALAALRALRDPRAFDAYARLLEDPRLAPEGAHALRELGDPRAIALLGPLAERTPYALTRNAALLALASLRAPDAAARLRDALGREPQLSDPFAVLRALESPFTILRGTLSLTESDVRGRARVSLEGPAVRGPVALWLELRSAGSCVARVGALELSVTSERRAVRVLLPALPRAIVLERCPGLTVSAAVAGPQAASARGGP
jgi:arylsulfatase A-like enzyme/HEAT repeat protein